MNHAIICQQINRNSIKYSIFDDKTLKNYFSKVGKYRGVYLISMKAFVSKELKKKGYSLTQIGSILGLNHSTVVNLNKREFIQCELDFLDKYFDKCIIDNLIPKTFHTKFYIENYEKKHIHHFKLEKL